MGWPFSMASTSNAPFRGQVGSGQRALRATWVQNLYVAVHRNMVGHKPITLRSGDAWGFA